MFTIQVLSDKKDFLLKKPIVSMCIVTLSTWIVFSIKQRCIHQKHTWCYVLTISKIMVSKRLYFFNCSKIFRRFMNSFYVNRPVTFIAFQRNRINKNEVFLPLLFSKNDHQFLIYLYILGRVHSLHWCTIINKSKNSLQSYPLLGLRTDELNYSNIFYP